MTRGQRRALETLWSRFQPELPVDWRAEFGRDAPLGVEIGFGMGHALLDWAERHPDWNLVGIEVYQPGIGALLLGLEQREVDNVRVLEGDAAALLVEAFAPGSLQAARIFFPDPWPKKRHHKRRLVQPEFVSLLADRLAPGGLLLLATDWAAYAEWMLEVLDAEPALENLAGTGCYAARSPERPVTRFEARGERLGHPVWDLAYRRKRANSESR
jgi:tRNA (guanine-N7-)-methyltransferase